MWKTLWQKEKLHVLCNFFFCYYVFKKLSAANALECVCKWERVNEMVSCIYSFINQEKEEVVKPICTNSLLNWSMYLFIHQPGERRACQNWSMYLFIYQPAERKACQTYLYLFINGLVHVFSHSSTSRKKKLSNLFVLIHQWTCPCVKSFINQEIEELVKPICTKHLYLQHPECCQPNNFRSLCHNLIWSECILA